MDDARRNTLFQEIINTHGPAIRRLCGGYEHVEALRHELEQEVLLNIWRALPSFRGDASLRTWMYRVAHNTATRHASKASRAPRKTYDEAPLDRAVSPAPNAAQQVEQADARAALRAAVGRLRALDRQLILLYFEEVDQGEIAEITGLTRANVSTRIHRIKAELTEMLSR